MAHHLSLCNTAMQGRNHASRSFAIVVIFATVVSACAPGFSPAQVQSMVQTSVVGTIESQNRMGTAVALTVSALAPVATATSSPTPVTPTVMSATPFVVVPTTAAASKKRTMACDINQRPFDETAYKPGDAFDIKWTITNTGTKTWSAGMDFKYAAGTHLTTATSVELPGLQPNDRYSVTFDANAPLEKGRYVMTWIVEGGLCSTSVVIVSGRPGIDP